MSQVQIYKCEVCGVQERDHSKWLLVSDQPLDHNIDIFAWNDKLAAQPGICHLCCAAHVQALVGAWVTPDLGIPPQPELGEDADALLRKFHLDRACLSSSLETDRESMLSMLDVVEIVLQGAKTEDDEPAPVFDA